MPRGEHCDIVHLFTKIQNGDIKGVGDFINDENEIIAPFDNEKGESAAAVALKSKQLAVYETLISKGWWLNSNENFNEIVNNLKNILKNELREIHEKFTHNPDELTSLVNGFLERNRYILPNNCKVAKSALSIKYKHLLSEGKINKTANEFMLALNTELRLIHKRNFIMNPNEEHLISLISRTSIYFGGGSAKSGRQKYLHAIAGAYEQLNDCREIRAIFKVLANVKNLNIIFDFNRDSIDHADPAGNPNVQGRTYAVTGEVYIGAKALSGTNRSEVLGVLAHELCHVAMFHIYNNDYKPYHKDDSDGQKDFESVLCDCEKKLGKEIYIDVVLNGPEHHMHDELCVRVPHLLALYQEEIEKMKYLKETFKNLFEYFEKKILQDLEIEIELMSAVWKLKSKEPQHLIESKILLEPRRVDLDLSANKVLEISSNCPQLTLNWIMQEMTSKPKFNFLFTDIYHLKDEDKYDLMVDAYSSCVNPRIVIDCENAIEKEILKITEKMKNDKICERIIFVHDHKESFIENATPFEVSHSWLDLMDHSKNNLIKRTINFQGEKIILEEIVDLHCDALDFVPLKELLDNYLKIGNEIKFPEIDIHIQRKFQNNKSEEIEPSQLLNIAETSKLILLSDDPGMGKTTELKMLATEFKKNLKNFWVAFVDLKEHSDFYEKDENFKTEFNSPKDIANFLIQKLFKLKEFEARVFKNLFSDDRVVLLLDGFDEISPSFNKFVTMLIKSIKSHSKNILIISTRPHLKDELCRDLNVEAYTLIPLTDENCEEILEKSFVKNGLRGADLKNKLDQTKDIFKKLKIYSNPVKNPLILRMIAKISSDDQFAKDMEINTFSIYENFIQTMIMVSMDRGHDAKREATIYCTSEFNIIRFYQKKAFKVIFEDVFNFKSRIHIYLYECFTDVQAPPDQQITRIALMTSDGSGKFQFIHRTFAEFFVADFLFKNIFDLKVSNKQKLKNPVSERRLETIHEIFQEVFRPTEKYHADLFFIVRSFIDGALKNLIPKIAELEKNVSILSFSDYFIFPGHFEILVKEGLLNIITFVTRCAENQNVTRLWVPNIFMIAAEHGSLDFNTKLTELAREIFNEKDFRNFFTEKNENGETVASISLKMSHKAEIIDFYYFNELLPSPLDDKRNSEKEMLNILEIVLDKDIFVFLELLEKIQNKCYIEYIQRFLNYSIIDEWTIYFYVCRYFTSIEDFDKLWKLFGKILDQHDFKILIKKPTSYGLTPLMLKAMENKKEVFISFWKLLTEGQTKEETEKLLMEEDGVGFNLFDCATWNKDPETFLAIRDLYLGTLGEDKMRIILIREREDGESVLFRSVGNFQDNVATVKVIWKFIQEIFDVSNQKKILMNKDEEGKTFYEKIVDREELNDIMKIFEPFIEEHLTKLEKVQFKHQTRNLILNYFTEKNMFQRKNGQNAVSLAFKKNPSPYDQMSDNELYTEITFQILRFPKEEIFRDEMAEYFQHFLKTDTFWGKSIYSHACEYLYSVKGFKNLWNFLQKVLGKNDFKTLLTKPNERGWTPLMCKAGWRNKEVFISFWILLTDGLTDEEKEKLLIEENKDGNNPFDCATRNEDPETFLAIKDLYVETFGEDKMRIMLMRERKFGEIILHVSVRSDKDNVETVKALWTFIQEIFEFSIQKTIFMKTNEQGETFSEKILDNRYFNEKIKIFWPFIEHLTALEFDEFKMGIDKRWLRHYFTDKSEKGENIISLIFKSNKIYTYPPFHHLSDEELYSMIKCQIFRFLKCEDISALQTELKNIKEVSKGYEHFQHFLNSWTSDGETIYLNACRSLSSIEDYVKLWKLFERIFGKNDFKTILKKPSREHGTTPLMLKAQYGKKEIFISFWKLLSEDLTDEGKVNLLVEEDKDGNNPFDCATFNEDPETFLAIKDLYVETFGEDKMRIMLMRERKFGEIILHVSVRSDKDNVETVKALWTFIQEIFDVSTQKTILMKKNNEGDSFYGKLVNRKDFTKRIKIFEPFIEEHLTTREETSGKDQIL